MEKKVKTWTFGKKNSCYALRNPNKIIEFAFYCARRPKNERKNSSDTQKTQENPCCRIGEKQMIMGRQKPSQEIKLRVTLYHKSLPKEKGNF